MEYLYIDESGSMTSRFTKPYPFFVVSIIRASNTKKLKKLHKRFVRNNIDELREADKQHQKMFDEVQFKELKGAAFTPDLKRKFVSFFCKNHALEIFYIVIDNKDVSNSFYDNTARAFNYTLKLALEYFRRRNMLPDDSYLIQLDERNERTETKYFLENYLNTELRMNDFISHDIKVEYFNSENNRLIQLSDVFANLYFSELMTHNYQEAFKMMEDEGYIRYFFKFPPRSKS